MLRSGNNASNLCSYSLNYVLLLFTDDVMHMPHFTSAAYHTLPPRASSSIITAHNAALLPFLCALVDIHALRYMHGWSKIATEALDLGSRTRSEAPRTLSARCWTRFASFGVKPFFKVTKRAHQVL